MVALQIAFASERGIDLLHADRKKKRHLLNNKNFDANPLPSFGKQLIIGKKVIPLSQYNSSMPLTIV